MGGNALKHLNPLRLTSAEMVELTHHIHRNWQLVHDRPLYLVPWVAEKQDHGDIDLICEAEPADVLRWVERMDLDAATIHRNDKVLSIPVPLPWSDARPRPVAQVDFICCRSEDAACTRFFYADGDFGMLLGRVAAWHGLVFGMDGLRYRADKNVPWQRDVHLCRDPGRILDLLGYPKALPWFDTYDRLWSFVLSSPMAGPWMFMPEATNHENRSRDRQRRKVGDFQTWLGERFAGKLTAPAPRKTPAEARAWVKERLPEIDIDGAIERQVAQRDHEKRITRIFGLDAAADVLEGKHPREVLGKVVQGMQMHLAPKDERLAAIADPRRWADQVRLARAAATAAARRLRLPVRDEFPPLPDFVPAPV